MARKPRPVDPTAGPLQEFAHDLRMLREKAGNPTYRSLAQKAGFGATTLGEAAGGVRFPSLDVTLAYVGACSGDAAAWEERWQEVNRLLSGPVEEVGEADQAAQAPALPADPPPTPEASRWGWSRTWWPGRVALGGALVLVAGAAVLLSGVGSSPASPGAAPGTVNVDETCPTFSEAGAFKGETYLGQTAVRTEPSTSAELVKNVPRSCWLQFTGYCLGAVVLDRNDVGQALPDERWFEIVGGNLMASAVVHGEPPASMQPNSCPGSVAGPTSISVGVVSDANAPGWAMLSAHGAGVRITGYAAYFAPVDAPGTAADWHEIGVPTSADGFNVPWTLDKAGEAPSSTSTLVVATACLAGDAPTSVTNAVQVVPSNPATAKPVSLSAAMLAKAAAVACAIP